MGAEDVTIRSVELLQPRKGDVLLVTVPERLRAEGKRIIGESFGALLPEGVKVAIVSEDVSVRVVRREDACQGCGTAEACPIQACPYVYELGGDKQCNCCDGCRRECAMDI